MESCKQKSVKEINIYLRYFKVATLCLDSFAHSWRVCVCVCIYFLQKKYMGEADNYIDVSYNLSAILKWIYPTNLTQMWEALESTWASIAVEHFRPLVESMPQPIEAVLSAKRVVQLNIRKMFLMFCTLSVYHQSWFNNSFFFILLRSVQ